MRLTTSPSSCRLYAAYDNPNNPNDRQDDQHDNLTVDQLADIAKTNSQHYALPPVPRRIHVLGLGGLGKFVAHSLLSVAEPPPITLLYHRPVFVRRLKNQQTNLEISTPDGVTESRGPYDTELVLPERKQGRQSPGTLTTLEAEEAYERFISNEPIHNLVVTTKSNQVIPALRSVSHRLTANSTILFLQDGMGVVDAVDAEVFKDRRSRPSYIVGVNSHVAHGTGPYTAQYSHPGVMYLGLLARSRQAREAGNDTLAFNSSARYLLRAFTRVPQLAAVPLPPSQMFMEQVEKLAVSCVVDALTVMLDARNGEILGNFALTRVMRLLLAEVSAVALRLPELRAVPGARMRLSVSRLENVTRGVLEKTKQELSGMLRDVRKGEETEVEWLNGYVVRRGEEEGIKPVMNYLLMQMVKGKQGLVRKEITGLVPGSEGVGVGWAGEVKGVGSLRRARGGRGLDVEREGEEEEVGGDGGGGGGGGRGGSVGRSGDVSVDERKGHPDPTDNHIQPSVRKRKWSALRASMSRIGTRNLSK
ncbi:MAG: hypothetical protein M1831_006677 [Alyxoria varia]|nr:MAG: hypothetical protein M1831_006677 [Alyxoria varia]